MSESEEERDEVQKQRFLGFEEDLSGISVPDELPVLPLRGVVIFPSAIVPLLISRGSSLKVVEQVLAGDRMLGLVAQKNPEDEDTRRRKSLQPRYRRPHPEDAQVS